MLTEGWGTLGHCITSSTGQESQRLPLQSPQSSSLPRMEGATSRIQCEAELGPPGNGGETRGSHQALPGTLPCSPANPVAQR